MKTIAQGFNELPEPYRTQVLNNPSKGNRLQLVSSLRDAVITGIVWYSSNEGTMYWLKFYQSL